MKSQAVHNSGEAAAMQGHASGSPDRELLVLGRIRTMDPSTPAVRAMAVRDGVIAARGTRSEAAGMLSSDAPVLDVGERLVLPGLIDAHAHLVDGGLFLAALDLDGVTSRSQWDARVSAHLDTHEGAWVTGGGWDHERWGGRLPDRAWLDTHTGTRPALLMRSDLHMALASSAALTRAGIDRDGRTADPDGGQIVRREDGTPTGVLRDTAIELVTAHMPAPEPAELRAAVERAVAHAHRHGVTQIHDMGELPPSWRDLDILEAIDAEGLLSLRVSAATPVGDWSRLADRIASRGRGGEFLRWGGVKGFVDGSLGAGTARFHEPFDDLPDSRGLVVNDPDQLRSDIESAWDAGIQPIVHAIGDAAVDWLVDVFEGLGPVRGDLPPPRIEHAQHLGPDTAERMARSGAIASMQPVHLVADAPWLERRLGVERASRSYAIRTLAEAGVPLAFGSDWTVAPLDPLVGIRAAVERRGVDGTVFETDEAIGWEQALAGYTRGAAAAAGFRDRTGILAPGAWADFVVLEENEPLDAYDGSYEGLGDARVARTFVGGAQVYRRETG